MRIANKTIFDSVTRSLGRTSKEMFDSQEVVTTGKKINRLSDDPVGIVSVLNLRSSLANLNQMERNISMGRTWLTACESALSQTHSILSSVKELSVQMANATQSASERANSVVLVDGYLKQIISLSNTQSGDRYIFGGTETDAAPFALNTDETQVEYSGNETPFAIKIGKNSNIEIGKNGENIFGENWDDDNIFKTLMDLKTSLQDDNIEGINECMDKLDSHMSEVSAQISEIAGKNVRLDVKEEILSDLELTYTERKSQIEDADIADAITNLNLKELAYNAALQSSSMIMKLSLVDFV